MEVISVRSSSRFDEERKKDEKDMRGKSGINDPAELGYKNEEGGWKMGAERIQLQMPLTKKTHKSRLFAFSRTISSGFEYLWKHFGRISDEHCR